MAAEGLSAVSTVALLVWVMRAPSYWGAGGALFSGFLTLGLDSNRRDLKRSAARLEELRGQTDRVKAIADDVKRDLAAMAREAWESETMTPDRRRDYNIRIRNWSALRSQMLLNFGDLRTELRGFQP
jgi:hypothetical protein